MGTTVIANKTPLGPEEAWARLSQGKRVTMAMGKKIVTLIPGPANREAILAAAIGRSGKLRAPTLQVGATFYVGFNAEMYEQLGLE